MDDGLPFLLRPQPFWLLAPGLPGRSLVDCAANPHRQSVPGMCGAGTSGGLATSGWVGAFRPALEPDHGLCIAGNGWLFSDVPAQLHLLWCAARHGSDARHHAADGGMGQVAVVSRAAGTGVALGRRLGAAGASFRMGAAIQWTGPQLVGLDFAKALYRRLCAALSVAGRYVVGDGGGAVARCAFGRLAVPPVAACGSAPGWFGTL